MTAHRQLQVSDLSPDQLEAYNAIRTWLNRGAGTKRTLSLGGYAGSGKSALVSVLAHEMPKPLAFCAFTGKASSVLGRKLAASGIATVNRVVLPQKGLGGLGGLGSFEVRPYCGTIHGLVYRPCDVCMVVEEHEHTYGEGCDEDKVDADGGVTVTDDEGEDIPTVTYATEGKCLACHPPPPKKKSEGPCRRCNDARFLRRDRLDRSYRLIVIDEASMVSDDMLQALLGYNVPILAVGDHGQLPPVRGQGSLMRAPDLRLEKIHRQAEGSPIIALSARIRETGNIEDRLEDGVAFNILAMRDLQKWLGNRYTSARRAADPRTPAGLMSVAMVSWTNKLRVNLNCDAREALGIVEGTPPLAGEALICLKNSPPVYNGMRGVLTGDAIRAGDAGGKAPKWKATVDFVEDGQKAENILLSQHQFFEEKTLDYEAVQALGISMSQLGQLYDFGYAMTCHKMQGSQAPEVGVVVEPGMARLSREDRTRWLYTAVTRAADRLTVIR